MNLPPLPPSDNEFWEGEKFSTEIKELRCKHKEAEIINGELRCPCGSAWTGSNLETLLKLLTTER